MRNNANYIVLVSLIAVTVASAGWTVVHGARNPMEQRWVAVEEELSLQAAVGVETNLISDHDFRAVYDWLAIRSHLWRPLVAVPKQVKEQPKPPMKQTLFNGIKISRSEEMTTADGERLIMVYDNTAKTKQWMTVGDTLRGQLSIAEIQDDRVTFHYSFYGKTIKYDWSRR